MCQQILDWHRSPRKKFYTRSTAYQIFHIKCSLGHQPRCGLAIYIFISLSIQSTPKYMITKRFHSIWFQHDIWRGCIIHIDGVLHFCPNNVLTVSAVLRYFYMIAYAHCFDFSLDTWSKLRVKEVLHYTWGAPQRICVSVEISGWCVHGNGCARMICIRN